ncbi:hypothetical protein RD792_011731 [Penstemon davidsonii]|uniref:FH2 domain-containing protein n=1 Tax=Penstemon davidsonii TaxID=160366 RepID=A0ABR0CUW3_9LAMI|nr:hypothetical protein RD792_011731 [Penstemon davidsonii]
MPPPVPPPPGADGHGLNADTIEKLTRIAPTDEETSQILAFNDNPIKLADAESFLYHVLKAVPTAFNLFNAMLFRSNYDLEVSHLKESLQYLKSACNELRNRGLFLKLLEAVLQAGNRLMHKLLILQLLRSYLMEKRLFYNLPFEQKGNNVFLTIIRV